MDHLVAVAELLRHDAQHPGLVLWIVRALEGAVVLLDRAELCRCLRAHDHEQLLRGLLVELLRRERLRLSFAVADLDLRRHVLLEARAETELRVLREVLLPALRELRVLGEVVPLPVLDGRVIGRRQHADLVAHCVKGTGRRRRMV